MTLTKNKKLFNKRSSAQSIIVFDGLCNLCNGSVNFIVKRDHHNRFKFASMQSEAGQAIIQGYDAANVGVDTFLLIKNGEAFYRTNAALEICKDLSGLWFLMGVFNIIPRFVRDAIYSWVAKRRYAIFGRRDVCRVPTASEQDKFITTMEELERL